ncbi:hypothetical protein HOLleu_17157 [Holothuria leucospilota]|uniref:Uncharacterized protein n=1 Tax=Holothuria leucospilota TaxID=206669 RepID=A0A9Q1C552_HOLLE|nr:hypothetical protein HOLleu_17157 [Holothuria leucospilota]
MLFILGICTRYIQKMDPIDFGKGQRLSEVTGKSSYLVYKFIVLKGRAHCFQSKSEVI